LAKSKQPKFISSVHKYLVYVDVRRVFKGKERESRAGENEIYIEEKKNPLFYSLKTSNQSLRNKNELSRDPILLPT
jgi:hypothetical protein